MLRVSACKFVSNNNLGSFIISYSPTTSERCVPLCVYADTVKRHNVCKRHVAIDTGVKQTERIFFLHIISIGQKL